MVIMIILFVVTNKNNTMDKNLNCGGGDYGIPASYDVDMCEGCPKDSHCYKVHRAFLEGEITDGFKTYY